MKKLFAIITLLSISSNAFAHSHPGIDAISHAVEHLVINYQNYLPYVLAVEAIAILAIGYYLWAKRRSVL